MVQILDFYGIQSTSGTITIMVKFDVGFGTTFEVDQDT